MIEKKKEHTKRLGVAASATLALAFGGLCTPWAGAATVTADYSNNFTGTNDTAPADFGTSNTKSGATSSLDIESNALRYTLSGSTTATSYASSVVEVGNLGGTPTSASNFTLSSTLNLGSTGIATGGNKTVAVGLAALGTGSGGKLTDSGDQGSSLSNFYWANMVIAISQPTSSVASGTLNLAGHGFSVGSGGTTGTVISLNTSDTYQFTLIGTYVGSSLNLAFTVTDLDNTSNTVTVSLADTNPLTGDFFGYRTRTSSGSSSLNIQANFDDFSVAIPSAIPEPATASLALGSLAAATLVRRKRRMA